MRNIIKNNWSYLFWFAYYILLFGLLTFGIIIPIYIAMLLIALSPFAEELYHRVIGVRPLRLSSEKIRLTPLFDEVYEQSISIYPRMPKRVVLYIQESMDINAFAFGKCSLVLTKGSINMLDDGHLKGLIAHELGHFANGDTKVNLFFAIANLPMTLLLSFGNKIQNRLETGILKFVFDIIFSIFKGINFISELMIAHQSRQNEYRADYFALMCGFGVDLSEVLTEIYEISLEKPRTIKEQLKSTHPPLTKRVELLESDLYNEDMQKE